MKDFFVNLLANVKRFLSENKDEILKPTVVLLCICIIIPLALAVTNAVTAGRIKELDRKNTESTMATLVKADKYNEKAFNKDGFTYYEAVKEGKTVAYIFKTAAKGYGGDVSVMTAISPDGKISNLAILDVSSETPGLGQNASKKEFYGQFKDKADKISVTDIDTVTGATITSKAVTNAVNEALESFKKLDIKPISDEAEQTEETIPNETEGEKSEAE